MKVIRVELGKGQLLAMPEPERAFFLTLGHILNELNALTRMMYWAAGTPAKENSPEDHGRFAVVLLLVRLLAGKLNEAWEFFQRSFFGAGLSKRYEPQLDDMAESALGLLKRYFGSRNHVHVIRNDFAFHYSPQEISAVLPKVEDRLPVYLEREVVPNNLFYSSEMLLAQALLEAIMDENDTDPYDSLVKELFDVSAWFAQASDGLLEAILMNHGELRISGPEEVQFEALENFQDVTIPWFTDTSHVRSGDN